MSQRIDGPALRELRQRLNIKQTEMAPLVGLTQQIYSQLELGHVSQKKSDEAERIVLERLHCLARFYFDTVLNNPELFEFDSDGKLDVVSVPKDVSEKLARRNLDLYRLAGGVWQVRGRGPYGASTRSLSLERLIHLVRYEMEDSKEVAHADPA